MTNQFRTLRLSQANAKLALVLFVLIAHVYVVSPAVFAADPQAGLSQRIALPKYNPWLTDPEFASLRPDIITPHTPWATPYAQPSLNIVVIAPRWTHRATIELQQRFDFDIAPILTYRSHDWGDTNKPHYAWISHGTDAIVTEQAMAALSTRRRPDVIVIGWMDSSVIPKPVEQKIIDLVAQGSGLVIFNPKAYSDKLEKLVKQSRPILKGNVQAVLDGIPTQKLPPLAQSNPRDLIGQGTKFFQNDAGGRIVVVDYSARPSDTLLGVGDDLTPVAHGGSASYISPQGPAGQDTGKDVQDLHYDYYCSLAGRCILWAADNMPRAKLTGWERLKSQISTQSGAANLGTLKVSPPARSGRSSRRSRMLRGAKAELIIRDSDSVVEHRRSIEIGQALEIPVAVAHLKSGGHYADVILRDARGRTLDWGTRYFESTSGTEITAITADRESYQLDKPVPISITMLGELDGAALTVDLTDTHGRTIWSFAAPAKHETSMQADVSNALTIQCEIRATLTKTNVTLAQQTQNILVRQPHHDPDQYMYGAWAGTTNEFVNKHVGNIMAENGISTGILYGNRWADLNARIEPYMTRYYPANTDDKGLCIRKPCLTDPCFLVTEKAKLQKNTRQFMHQSPPSYSLGDDQAMMLAYQDACISDTCLPAFRKYLADQYGTLEALNASWQTSYTSFDQAMPLSLEDALAAAQYPRWADHRMYMDQLFVDTHRYAKDIIKQIDPDAKVGFEGPINDSSWTGYAWKKLMDVVDMMIPYPNPWKFDIVRSFARPGLVSGGWYGGYAMYRNPDDTRYYPWFLLFNGCNGYYFFSGYGGSEAGHPSEAVAPDLRVFECFRETTKHVKRIQQGIDRLVLGAQRQTDSVAIYFSRPSQHGATVLPDIPTRDYNTDPAWSVFGAAPENRWSLNTDAVLRLLDDIGLSYVFVDRTDITNGVLTRDNYRLLVMPITLAISAAEADQIQQFVRQGGNVLADFRPGIFDNHLSIQSPAQLDDLFGVKRSGSPMAPLRDQIIHFAAETAAKRFAGGERGGAMLPDQPDDHDAGKRIVEEIGTPLPVDTTVIADKGTAAITTDSGAPVFISNTVGKGRTLLVNTSLQHYLTLRAAGRGAGLRAIIAKWLDQAGIASKVSVDGIGDHNARVRTFVFESDQTSLVGLIRPHKRLLDESDAFIDQAPRKFDINFGRQGHIYDVINRKYISQGQTHQLDVPIATPMLFAIMPYRVTSVTADISQAGQTVTVAPTVHVSTGKPGRHVICVGVSDAAGRRRPEYDHDFINANGQGDCTFNLALNDPPGKWIVQLEDTATGVTGEAEIVIELLHPGLSARNQHSFMK